MKTGITCLGILNPYFSLENEVGKRSWKTKLENEVKCTFASAQTNFMLYVSI